MFNLLNYLEADDAKILKCGTYNRGEIKNSVVGFRDERHGKYYRVHFNGGKIWLVRD